jgi:hypothetical protein
MLKESKNFLSVLESIKMEDFEEDSDWRWSKTLPQMSEKHSRPKRIT